MLMAAGVTAAVVTAAFVFWGPTGSYAPSETKHLTLNKIGVIFIFFPLV